MTGSCPHAARLGGHFSCPQRRVHEQARITGEPEILGQILVENATSVDSLVTDNTVSGNVEITYNGNITSDTFGVSRWRDVR